MCRKEDGSQSASSFTGYDLEEKVSGWVGCLKDVVDNRFHNYLER